MNTAVLSENTSCQGHYMFMASLICRTSSHLFLTFQHTGTLLATLLPQSKAIRKY